MKKATVTVEKLQIPTYTPCEKEPYPMFAENRVHQRTSGDPYPNAVALRVDRSGKTDKTYTAVRLENEYVEVVLLPEIGGRIYYARDKRTGYDFFYHQHVIKPALIGVLGNWVSGGVEFNWPFHHSPSGFLPYDHEEIAHEDGTAECILSANDPIDRLRARIHVVLQPGATYFATRVEIFNRTECRRSFLWWENAAVPVNENYRIFFPPDVRHVNFHYLKSRTTYPISRPCVYNGIPIREPLDLSYHKNTRDATSYFAAASRYDYFGGYDTGKDAGVVHIADHHVSPGKKMFTWGYNQLSRSWERALTDTDGAYAELMAGCYSDNQPNFSWIEPYETKTFTQFWYPLCRLGVPTFATLDGAICVDREAGTLAVLPTSAYRARVSVTCGGKEIFARDAELSPDAPTVFPLDTAGAPLTVKIERDGEEVLFYEERAWDELALPETIEDMPEAAAMTDPDELYRAGVHVAQYRDPAVLPDAYYLRALERDPRHAPTLLAMAAFCYDYARYGEALDYADRAIAARNRYNEREEDGRAYYVRALILEARGDDEGAYDDYARAAWSYDCVARAMTRMALIDLRHGRARIARERAAAAFGAGIANTTALLAMALSDRRMGKEQEADALLGQVLARDPADAGARVLRNGPEAACAAIRSPAPELCLDTAVLLSSAGEYRAALGLLEALGARGTAMTWLMAAEYAARCGEDPAPYEAKAAAAPIGETYPSRREEAAVLAARAGRMPRAAYLLGCYLYHKRHYEEAAALWEGLPLSPERSRCLAIAYFSHLGRPAEARALLDTLAAEHPDEEQLLYEDVILMLRTGAADEDVIDKIRASGCQRDDVVTERARACVRAGRADEALDVLLSHRFVPCEGGEHAVAEPYLYAWLDKGLSALTAGQTDAAVDALRRGQVVPDELGAGIWNRCKLVPLRFAEALALERGGRTDEARAIFADIAAIPVDYFSNMHLGELPYFIALSLRHLGRGSEGNEVMTRARRAWEKIRYVRDNGFFGTTPFFICYIEAPEKLRLALWHYRMALVDAYRGDDESATAHLAESLARNRDNFPAQAFRHHGFFH